jgi:hypothetical protein
MGIALPPWECNTDNLKSVTRVGIDLATNVFQGHVAALRRRDGGARDVASRDRGLKALGHSASTMFRTSTERSADR